MKRHTNRQKAYRSVVENHKAHLNDLMQKGACCGNCKSYDEPLCMFHSYMDVKYEPKPGDICGSWGDKPIDSGTPDA